MIFVISISLVGCTLCPVKDAKDDSMYILASQLTKLCKAVEATVRYEDVPDTMTDAELLTRATSHDPPLLAPFSDYTVKTLRQDRHALLLVCTKDGASALLEDACCSPPLDVHHWLTAPPRPCTFSLKTVDVCK
jgi:hypothetical protein